MADAESRRIAERFSDEILPTPELVKLEAADSRLHLIDALWDAYIHSPAAKGVPDISLNALKFDFREQALPLRIACPVPREELRASVMPLSACIGAIAGMAVLTPLMRLLFGNDYREFGLLMGAPLGALLLVAGIRYVSRHAILLRSLQALLGLATAAEVVSLFLSPLNPFRLVWRTLSGRFGGKGLWGSIKRVLCFILAILLLQLAVPIKKAAREQLKTNTDSALRAWLDAQVLLLSLLAASTGKTTQPADNDSVDPRVLRAVAKLVQSSEHDYPVLASEIILAFKNAGYDFQPPIPAESFHNDLRGYFSIEGMIEPGDQVKILEPALFKNKACILKGKLTRKRQ